LYRRLGGPQGWSGRVRKISPPPGFDPRSVQPVAIRYTDWAISTPVTIITITIIIITIIITIIIIT
jgi:bacteriorhodopsin